MTGTSTTPVTPVTAITGVRHAVDLAYGYLSALFGLAVLAQVSLAGLGAFGHGFTLHRDLGNSLGIFAIVLLILALIAHISRWTMIGALVLAILTEPVQHALAGAGESQAWAGSLHALDGMAILLLATWIIVTARNRLWR